MAKSIRTDCTIIRLKFWFPFCLTLLINFCSFRLSAQLVITSPVNNQIQQRDNSGFANIAITGYASLPYSRVEGKLIPLEGSNNKGREWTFDTDQINKGLLISSQSVATGWYRLIVTGYGDRDIVDSTEVSRVGVGEVFLVAGNSNAMGLPDLGAKGASENVISFNATNKFLNDENITVAPDEPMPVPVFNPLKEKNSIFPSGETAWYWGELGDLLYERLRTPVLFFNAAWAAANSENYRVAALGQNAHNIYVDKDWPNRQPFTNIVNTLRYLNSTLGIRAVLWSQGENDAQIKVTENEYFENIKTLIDKSRENAGSNVSWIIAKNTASQTLPGSYEPVTNAQYRLATLPGFNTYIGPDLDTVQIPRPTHGHFENLSGGVQGISLAASAWNHILTDFVFQTITPLQPIYSIHTGVVPSRLFAGASFSLPYYLQGNAGENQSVHAELLDDTGKFIDTVGTGNISPLQINLPSNLENAHYKVRVVGTSIEESGSTLPVRVLPGSVSTSFSVNNISKKIEYLNSFNARIIGQDIYVSWLMAANPGMQSMVLQKTTDGETYTDLQSFDASEIEDQSHVYAFLDSNTGEGTVFYRIKMKFQNGDNSYSAIAAIFRKNAPLPLIAFPNPVTNQELFLRKDNTSADLQFSLLDVSGREHSVLVSDREVTGVITLRPSVQLPSGKYILKIINGSQVTTQNVVFY